MGNEEELCRIAKKLDKISVRKDTSSAAQALDLLKSLQRMPITLDLIQRSRVGLIVNKLRKSIADEEVVSLSKSLIKSWKKLLSEKDNGRANSVPSQSGDTNSADSDTQCSLGNSKSGQANPSTERLANPSSQSGQAEKNRFSNCMPRQTCFPADTTNSVRLKCREMLANALRPEPEMEGEGDLLDHVQLGSLIEDAIYKEMKDTNMKYKSRIRSRVANLNDKKNPDLKLNVLRGAIKPDKIAVMTADEMASNEMKQLRQKFTKEGINDAQMSFTGGTKTDLLKCPACKKNNCTYNQVQTRSADEPMTTFCYCNECGKRWKFC